MNTAYLAIPQSFACAVCGIVSAITDTLCASSFTQEADDSSRRRTLLPPPPPFLQCMSALLYRMTVLDRINKQRAGLFPRRKNATRRQQQHNKVPSDKEVDEKQKRKKAACSLKPQAFVSAMLADLAQLCKAHIRQTNVLVPGHRYDLGEFARMIPKHLLESVQDVVAKWKKEKRNHCDNDGTTVGTHKSESGTETGGGTTAVYHKESSRYLIDATRRRPMTEPRHSRSALIWTVKMKKREKPDHPRRGDERLPADLDKEGQDDIEDDEEGEERRMMHVVASNNRNLFPPVEEEEGTTEECNYDDDTDNFHHEHGWQVPTSVAAVLLNEVDNSDTHTCSVLVRSRARHGLGGLDRDKRPFEFKYYAQNPRMRRLGGSRPTWRRLLPKEEQYRLEPFIMERKRRRPIFPKREKSVPAKVREALGEERQRDEARAIGQLTCLLGTLCAASRNVTRQQLQQLDPVWDAVLRLCTEAAKKPSTAATALTMMLRFPLIIDDDKLAMTAHIADLDFRRSHSIPGVQGARAFGGVFGDPRETHPDFDASFTTNPSRFVRLSRAQIRRGMELCSLTGRCCVRICRLQRGACSLSETFVKERMMNSRKNSNKQQSATATENDSHQVSFPTESTTTRSAVFEEETERFIVAQQRGRSLR